MKNLSRRDIFAQVAQGFTRDSAASARSLLPFELLEPHHESFGPTLEETFPELRDHQTFQGLRRFSVLLRNTSHLHVRAYTVLWTYKDAVDPNIVGNLSAEFIQRHGSLVSENRHVPAGQARLLSPFFNVRSFQSSGDRLFVPPHLLLNEPLQRATEIKASLDGVVLSNGDFYGPDTTHLSVRYAAVRNAEIDEARSIHYHSSRNSSPWDPSFINALLDSHIQKAQEDLAGFEQVWWQSRRKEAERLRKRLADKGVAHLQECIDRRLHYKPVSLRKQA